MNYNQYPKTVLKSIKQHSLFVLGYTNNIFVSVGITNMYLKTVNCKFR